MKLNCEEVKSGYGEKLEEIVDIQRNRNREAIFFINNDGSTTEIIVGEETYIEIPPEKRQRILGGEGVIGSVHTHPAGFDPSTIDLMTAVRTDQDIMGVAVPITYDDGERDYTISLVDISSLNFFQRGRLMRSMRRSSVGVTNFGRAVRKEFNLKTSGVEGCRTHEVVIDGTTYPFIDRPSAVRLRIGRELGVREDESLWLD